MILALAISKKFNAQTPIIDFFIHTAQKLGYELRFCQENNIPTADMMVIFGGDGTVLHYGKQSNMPIVSVNMGRVGFLSQIRASEEDIESKLLLLKSKQYSTIRRTMLDVYALGKHYLALNDVVFAGIDRTKSVSFDLSIDGNISWNLVGDGLIVSTPTGSTAYCLASGGPAVTKESPVFVAVPLGCPNPSVVYPDDSTLIFTQNYGHFVMNVDGVQIHIDEQPIIVKKAKKKLEFVIFGNEFFAKLNSKLKTSF